MNCAKQGMAPPGLGSQAAAVAIPSQPQQQQQGITPQAPQVEPPAGWYTAGALLPAAALTRSGKAPHSFLPPDNVQQRAVPVAAEIVTDAGQAAVGGRLQVIWEAPHNITYQQLRDVLRQLDACTNIATQQQAAAAAGFSPLVLSQSSCDRQPAGVCADAKTVLDAGQGRYYLDLDIPADADSIQAMLQEFNERRQRPCLHHLQNPIPAEGVTGEAGKSGICGVVPRACHDTGCDPTVMAESYVKQAGFHYYDMSPAELAQEPVRNIEGLIAGQISARTEPLVITLAKGTAQEAKFRAERGVKVVKGPDAGKMFDMVLGRDFADSVSAFVIPFTQRLHYYRACSKVKSALPSCLLSLATEHRCITGMETWQQLLLMHSRLCLLAALCRRHLSVCSRRLAWQQRAQCRAQPQQWHQMLPVQRSRRARQQQQQLTPRHLPQQGCPPHSLLFRSQQPRESPRGQRPSQLQQQHAWRCHACQ